MRQFFKYTMTLAALLTLSSAVWAGDIKLKQDVTNATVKIGETTLTAESPVTNQSGNVTLTIMPDNTANTSDASQTGYFLSNATLTAQVYTTESAQARKRASGDNQQLEYSSLVVTKSSTAGTYTFTMPSSGDVLLDITATASEVALTGVTGLTYTGSAITPGVTIGGVAATADTDFSIAYDNSSNATANDGDHTNAGTVTSTITGTGNYWGTVSKTFTIGKAELSELVITAETQSFDYDGNAKTPTYTLKAGLNKEITVTVNEDFTITGNSETAANTETSTGSGVLGHYTLLITANESCKNFTGSQSANWSIVPVSITNVQKVTVKLYTDDTSETEVASDTYTYTGSAITPHVVIKYKKDEVTEEVTLTQDTDYSIEYADNTYASENAKVLITGKGNYAGTEENPQGYGGVRTLYFTINKAPINVTANNKTITYGDAPTNAGYTLENAWQGSDTESTVAITGAPTYTYNYTQYGYAGSYTITPDVSAMSAQNYTFTGVNGTLTVSSKEVGLDWSNTSFIFDGNSHVPTATATGLLNGDVINVTVTGGETNVGASYTATATELSGTKAACYKLPETNTKNFSITAADLPVTVEAYNAAYDGSAHGITVNKTGVAADADVTYCETENGTYNTDAITKTNVGTYTVYYKVTKTGYNEVKGSSTITITKAPIATVAVTGVTAPSTGAALVNTGASCATTGVTSISNVVWRIGDAGTMGTATPNTVYTAEVVLTADGNHEFTSGEGGTTGTIGGNSATATIDNEGNLHLSYTYAATDKVDPTAGMFEIIYPTDLLYDGTAKIATAVLSESYESAGVGSPTVVYYASTAPTTALSDAPVNAGTYILKVNVAEGTNYNEASGLANDSWTFTIEPCDYTVEGTGAATATFGTATNAVTGISGLTVKDVNSNTVSGSWAFTDTEVLSDVGNIEKTATFTPTTANANYKALTYPVTITVTAHNYTISGTVNATAVYGTATNAITISGLTVKDGDTEVAGSWAFASTDTDILEVGNTIAKTATFTPTDDVNYETLTHPITPVITPKSVTVSGITVTAKEYDGTTTATLDVSGATITGKVGEDDVTVASATGTYADANVGTGKQVTLTAITLGGTKMGNYTVDVANSTQPTGNITAKDITASIVVTVTNITTGGTPTVTVKVGTTTLVAGTDYTVTYKKGTDAVTTFNTAGTYTAVITAKDGSNYTFTQKEQNFTVSNPAPSVYYYSIDVTQPEHGTVSMDNNETYGAAGYTYNVTATADEGYYVESITVNGTAIDGNSFTMPYESVTVSAIIKAKTNIADATVTLDWTEKTYNGQTQKAVVSSVTVGETTLGADDYTVTYAEEAWKNAGEYTITVAAAEGKTTIMGSKTVTFTIAKAALTVTADDKTMTQGDELPVLTVSYSGFVNGETENTLTTKPTASTTATKTCEAGTYDITVDGGADDNYSFSYVKGTLTIKAKTPKTGDEVPVEDSGSGTQVNGKVTGSETDSQTGKTTYELTLTELPASVLNGTTSLADDDMQVEYQGNTYQVKKVEAGAFEGQASGVIIFLPDGVSTTAPVTNVVNGDGTSTELNLNNVTSFVAPKTVHADKVTYQRSTAAGFITLCLPYDFELPEGHTAWTLNKGVDGVAEFQAGGREVKAGEPYVIGVDDADKARKVTRAGASIDLSAENVTIAATTTDRSVLRDDVEMFGTIAGLSLTKGAELKALVIQPDFSWKMAPLTSEMYVPAFECYLVVKGDMASSIGEGGSIPSSFGDATGIWGIETDGLDDGDWYNLDGSRLEGKPKAKGLYIHNGRKVVIK